MYDIVQRELKHAVLFNEQENLINLKNNNFLEKFNFIEAFKMFQVIIESNRI